MTRTQRKRVCTCPRCSATTVLARKSDACTWQTCNVCLKPFDAANVATWLADKETLMRVTDYRDCEWFRRGVAARAAGETEAANRYTFGTARYYLWLAGFQS